MAVDVWRQGAVGFVRLNNPPVNAIGLSVRQGLWDALAWVQAQKGLSRVVLHGSQRVFAAGADAREFDAPPVAPHLPEILNGIEASDVPWVAAITGVALGGGCELALACRYRIAAPGVRIGLPEVTLGVVPGAGGTQRLPRLIGIAAAVDLIATGKLVPAEQAEALGLVDSIAEDPVDVARLLDVGTLELSVPPGLRDWPAADDTAIAAARADVVQRMPHQIAPPRAIDLVALCATTPLSDAMAQERAAFLDLRQGAQARALRHIFFAERAVRGQDTPSTSHIANRILARYHEAADTVLMDGSTPWEVDEAMVEFGYTMGPYEAQDLSGVDVALANRRENAPRDPNRRYIPIADRMIELGKLGKKVGAGWYRYPGGGGKVEDPIVADLALEEAHFAKITRCDYAVDEIMDRLLSAMINEAVALLDEGIATSAREIDCASVTELGFPRWRGGLMHYADTIGAKTLLARLETYAQEDSLAWAVSPSLWRCAEQGISLSDRFPG
ncbi:enoyl-CoA hydratase-related protein [Ruegeria lacuscaerulensis]|uniref:enoyl-CoA hydratase-related protein n=1 Tax=Ruegeria lacuscaerulensis TaxID=55218 RepID=UPI00147E4E36|nr:enoyl-CoA hydratase-related protein [Ruegeria lacuscaerulensis]